MLRSNVHTHSNFSDGANSIEEMALAAIARGFVSLGISDHGRSHDKAGMRDEQGYCAEVRRVRDKYADRLEIALGCEHEAFTREADLGLYDYVIESVHFLERDGLMIPIDDRADILQQAIDRHYGADPYAMCRDYFDRVSRSMLQPEADVVGHIGLISKFNEKQPLFDHLDSRYREAADQSIALAAERDLLVEINSGAMSRGYRRTPYPYLDQLKLLKEQGGRITITSDCHRAEWIDFGMDVSAEMAKAAGFQETWIWENGAFQPIKL